MKAVLMSIQPKWCELIASGKKTVEVRKTKPKLDVPFKVYIYCTKPNTGSTEDRFYIYLPPHDTLKQANGTVIGEFVCNRIDRIGKRGCDNNFDYCYLPLKVFGNDDIEIEITDIKRSCILNCELNLYGEKSPCVYAWHISHLVIYDKPRGLMQFHRVGYQETRDNVYGWTVDEEMSWLIMRPPQSWCYCEEAK